LPGVLLDTHALVWLVNGERSLTAEALAAIANSQRDGMLYVSPITGWELSVAAQKAPAAGRPDLGGQSARPWLREALALTGAKLIPINQRIAFEAADVPEHYGRRDPGDCFLIATARVRRIPIITRDGAMCDLARERPDYLTVISC
jgi:PIN domain nuclease of toxin-antitoxin system